MTEEIYNVDNMSDEEAQNEAYKLGWRPQDEFRGDPEKFTDAKTFLRNSNDNIPMLRENYRKIDAQNKRFQEELEVLKKQIAGTSKRLEDAERRGYEKAVQDIEAQQRRAALTGDVEQYDRLQQQKEALSANPAPQTGGSANNDNGLPIADQIALEVFNNTNPWFRQDVELNEDMSAYVMGIKARNPNMPMSEVLDKAKAKVIKANPEKFSDNKKANDVLSGSGNGGAKISYGDLSDKAVYDSVWAKMERSLRVKGKSDSEIEKAKKMYQANCLNNK